MTKYVISGYIGFDNFGDEAIAKTLISHLKLKNVEKITVLSSNPHKTARLYEVYSAHFLKFFKPILESDVYILLPSKNTSENLVNTLSPLLKSPLVS